MKNKNVYRELQQASFLRASATDLEVCDQWSNLSSFALPITMDLGSELVRKQHKPRCNFLGG